MQIFEQLIGVCQDLLYEYPQANKALNYLSDRLDTDTQRKFNFGFFPPQEQLNFLCSFVDKDLLIEEELLYENENHEGHKVLISPLQQHNLIMPYRDVYGNIVAIVGRSLLDDNSRSISGISKYKNTAFKKSRHLFGLYEAKQDILNQGYVYIVEGQFDCIKAHSHNIHNVAALGSANMSIEQLILLLRYTNQINLLLDNDEAGETGRSRIIEKYGKYANIKNMHIPDGFKDLDEFLSETNINGSRELESVLQS